MSTSSSSTRLTLTIPELEAVMLVAETRNFRLAAERAHLTQPALSRRVQAAEQKLNARLFDRNTHGVELTASGNELLPIARKIISEFRDSLSDLSEFVAGRRGNVVVAAMPSAAAAILPATIAAFQQAHPFVRVSVQALSAEQVAASVAAGTADFGISIAPPLAYSELQYERVMEDEFVLICTRDHALAREAGVDWSVLAEHPFIASGPTSSVRLITDRTLAAAGRSLTPRYECANISVVGAMVAAGVGVAVIPRLALRLVDTSCIAIVPLRSPSAARELGLLTRKARSLSTAATILLQTLHDQKKTWQPSQEPSEEAASAATARPLMC